MITQVTDLGIPAAGAGTSVTRRACPWRIGLQDERDEHGERERVDGAYFVA